MIWLALLGLVSVGFLAGELGGSGSSGDEGRDTEGPDAEGREIEGTDGRDLIFGGDGDDTISGHGGLDMLLGGDGNDVINGGADSDILVGGAGDDTLNGGSGDDLLIDGAGNDLLLGDGGDDVLLALSGQDTLIGGAGDDFLSGLDAPDDLGRMAASEADYFDRLMEDALADAFAAEGQAAAVRDEVLSVGAAVPGQTGDLLEGGAGDDTLVGDSGDTLIGGAGDDVFVTGTLRADHAYTADGYVPVRIVDHEPGEEIILTWDDILGTGPAAAPLLTVVQNGNDVELRLDNRIAAVVEGQTAASVEAHVQVQSAGSALASVL